MQVKYVINVIKRIQVHGGNFGEKKLLDVMELHLKNMQQELQKPLVHLF